MSAARAVSGDRDSWAISVADFDAWVAGARPGETVIYAGGVAIPRHQPAWTHARVLADDGVVTLVSRRSAAGARTWEYLAQRLAPPVDVSPAPLRVVSDDDDPAAILLRELRRAANLGLPCPDNATLARRAGLRDAKAASYRIGCLVQGRVIAVEQQGPGLPRVVTMLATGKRTAAGCAA